MIKEQPIQLDARTRQAVDELQATITRRYPTANFEVAYGVDDPHSGCR